MLRDYPLVAASNPAPRTVYAPTGAKEMATNLRHWYGDIQNQGNFGSCTAFASLQFLMALRKMDGLPTMEPSYFANYEKEREMTNTVTQDVGATIDAAVAVLEQYGAMPAVDDPYTPNDFALAPPAQDWDATYRLNPAQVQRIQHEHILEHMLDAFANGLVTMGGITCFAELEQDAVAMTGYLSMPANQNQPKGGHALNFIGNDPVGRLVLAINQWTNRFGIKQPESLQGCFWLPYEYIHEYAYDVYVGFPANKVA